MQATQEDGLCRRCIVQYTKGDVVYLEHLLLTRGRDIGSSKALYFATTVNIKGKGKKTSRARERLKWFTTKVVLREDVSLCLAKETFGKRIF